MMGFTGFCAVLILGFVLGWLFRGAKTKTRIAMAKDELRLAELQTKIEKERRNQDRMLEERIHG
jgi:cytochrome bd-type quinol oxidase subunit 2